MNPVKFTSMTPMMKNFVLPMAIISTLAAGIAVTKTDTFKDGVETLNEKTETAREEQFQKDLAKAKDYYYNGRSEEEKASQDLSLLSAMVKNKDSDVSKDEILVDSYKHRHISRVFNAFDDVIYKADEAIDKAIEKADSALYEVSKKADEKIESVSEAMEKPETWGTLAALGLLATGAGAYTGCRKKGAESSPEQKQVTNIGADE